MCFGGIDKLPIITVHPHILETLRLGVVSIKTSGVKMEVVPASEFPHVHAWYMESSKARFSLTCVE